MSFKVSLQSNSCSYSITRDLTVQECRHKLAQYAGNNQAVLAMFDRFVDRLSADPHCPIPAILEALLFAAEKHQGQTRKDKEATPYIIHPIGVALSVWEEGDVRNVNTVIAALLHDTIEDTGTTKEEIAARFGKQVSDIVLELSNPKGLSSQAAKEWQIQHAPSLSHEAKTIKLADRLYNLRDLRNADWPEQKKQEYYGWGEKLVRVLAGTNPNLENLLWKEITIKARL